MSWSHNDDDICWEYQQEEIDGCRFNFVRTLTDNAHSDEFAVVGSMTSMPVLDIDGFGRLPLPLDDANAAKLAAMCDQAPFGRGSETVLDTTVRNVLEMDASKVQLSNPYFIQELIDVHRVVSFIRLLRFNCPSCQQLTGVKRPWLWLLSSSPLQATTVSAWKLLQTPCGWRKDGSHVWDNGCATSITL
jgi:hypothetical protein